jgi:SAM-dependent methyltransferase
VIKKRTKLTEKGTRIPNTRLIRWGKTIRQYLKEVEELNKESARSHRFAMLLQQLLSLEPDFIEDYCTGIEESLKVRQKDRILKGEADNLFGNIILEFEANITKKRSEAESQLCRYVAILWSREPISARTPYLCIATDGVRFITYSPTVVDKTTKDVSPEAVHLIVVEESDWTQIKPFEVFFWLDRHFLRKEFLHPTSETIVHDFGVKSHAFQITANALLALWQEIKKQSTFAVIYDSWEKYLRIVYGSKVAGDELFVRHTYLATLAKLMAWFRISESASLPNDAQILEMLEGQLFKRQGIENFIEEDFFSWLARAEAVKVGVGVVRWLFSLLQNYRLRELSEDVLKSLYQELVDPETRHDLGEFYTPDWLAHLIVNKLLDSNPQGSVLDPACGSGTFLYLTIREKIDRLDRSFRTLNHILDSVYGIDVHPLAVIVAKTNYLLALGDLLEKRKGKITIPIYLADSIKLPELVMETTMVEVNGSLIQQLPGYRVELDGQEIRLPERLIENISLYDQAIELAKDFSLQHKGKPISFKEFQSFLIAQQFPVSKDEALAHAIFSISEGLKQFIDIDRDSIWAFILKNIYKPLFFKRKFDFVIGNPPWIAFRFMEPAYQKSVRRRITEDYRLLKGRAENISNLEIATLFLVRAADLYIKSGGKIAFVMPRSLFSADQHDALRKRTFHFYEHPGHNLFWCEVWDLEKVEPLFNVPSCVLIADKRESAKFEYPFKGQIIGGKLDKKNASLVSAEKTLFITNVELSIHLRGKHSFWAPGIDKNIQSQSYYKSKFLRGADIHPRSFWFVQVKPSPVGINPNLPPIETADRAIEQAKNAYKGIALKGTVESHFLYATILSTDLLPFGHLDYRLVVLPIEPEAEHYKLFNTKEAQEHGFLHLYNWLEKATIEWTKRRASKAEHMSLLNWLDYRKKLTIQNPKAKYRIIYNTSGTYLTACVVKNEPINYKANGQEIKLRGFVADTKTYFAQTNSAEEAFYLAAILNAPIIDKLIKPMQSRGLWGPRDIHKKVLELPIPKFDAQNTVHCKLVEMGKECAAEVKKWLASGGAGKIKSIGRLRGMVRSMLKDELKEIDKLVKEILK